MLGIFNLEQSYSKTVKNCLMNIFMESEGISEKSFSKVDELSLKCDKIIDGNKDLINSFEAANARQELCAEIIFFKL